MARIFIVEDNEGLRNTVVSYLELGGHKAFGFAKLAAAYQAFDMQGPDLLILDVMLPDGDGFLWARKLRQGSNVPIIFLTARTAESDRITGFEVGGDDYLIKPFSVKELMLRVEALLRRSTPIQKTDPTEHYMFQKNILELQQAGHYCSLNGKKIQLTGSEWEILQYLAQNADIVISRERLLGACLDYTADGSERTIDTHIKNIRAKLKNAKWIETVRGYGYRFCGSLTTGDSE